MSFKAAIQQLQLSCLSACLTQTEVLRYRRNLLEILETAKLSSHRNVIFLTAIILLLSLVNLLTSSLQNTLHAHAMMPYDVKYVTLELA
jgi:hypothetical protein